jgi:multidrug efflux pump
MVINPALAAIFMKVRPGSGNPHVPHAGEQVRSAEEIARAGENPVIIKGPVLSLYARSLQEILNHKVAVVLIAVCILILLGQIWYLRVGLQKPLEFFPNIEPKAMYVNLDTPEGADLDYIDAVVRQVELAVNGYAAEQGTVVAPGQYGLSYEPKVHERQGGGKFYGPSDIANIEYIYAKAVVTAGVAMMFDPNAPNHIGIQFVDLEDRTSPSSESMELIRTRVENIPGAKITVAAQEEGPPTGAPINIEIAGDDFEILGRLAKSVRTMIAKIPFVVDIRDDYVEGTPTVRIKLDRQKAALFGLYTDNIGSALKTAYNGLEVSTYREGDEDYDITVQLSDARRRVTDVLRELMLPTPSGKMVPLTTLARIEFAGGLGDIVRINHERVVTVKANVDENKIPGPVARAQAEELLADFPMPPGYRLTFTGEFEFQQESEAFLSKAFVIALFLIFLVLVTQFNSVAQPFIIMSAVILSLGGAFLGLTVINSPFGIIMTGVGVISLAGVVVNNGIVLIDYINKLRQRGFELRQAVIAAGATRLRPVILTAVTTILGLIPMVTGVSYDFHRMAISWVSESSQWWRSMAIVVIFGLLVATFLTLVVVPALYVLIEESKERLAALRVRVRSFIPGA